MKKNLAFFTLLTITCTLHGAEVSEAEFKALQQRVALLEKIILTQEENNAKATPSGKTLEQIIEEQKLNARERIARDRRNYSPADLSKIELLFTEIEKDVDSPEAKNNLKNLIQNFQSANSTGCAFLKVGQLSRGPERAAYLKKAINEFGDCYFDNGAQVGPLAHFILVQYYMMDNQPNEARDILDRLKEKFPDAIDHNNNALSKLIPDIEALIDGVE